MLLVFISPSRTSRKEEFTVVAGVDVFVVKTGGIFKDPKVRAWIPVADGSHAF
jgi:hypothetical protein